MTGTPERVGVDIVAIDEVRQSLAAHGERYLSRVFTERERADCGTHAARLAARFAAKEALVKALRLVDVATPPREVETILQEGLPALVVAGSLRARLDEQQLEVASVSLSHTDCHAVACVLLRPRDR